MERIHEFAVQEDHVGPVSDPAIVDAWRAEFRQAPPVVTSPELYAEGLEMVRSYFRRNPEIDSRRLLANEQQFLVSVGRFVVLGYMDRVERLDEETVLVDDYKTSRKLFSAGEVETDLQASTYHLAARELYPWAKRVVFRFQMLRHGVALEAERDEDQLSLAKDYLVALAERSESGEESAFQPRTGPNCPYCDYRRRCPAYAEVLATRPEFAAIEEGDIHAVAREYQAMSLLAKSAYARRDELGSILRARIESQGPIEAAGSRYDLVPVSEREIAPLGVLDLLEQATSKSYRQIANEVLSVEKKALEKFLRSIDGPQSGRYRASPSTRLLRARIEASAEERPKTSRLDARPIRAELRKT
jgi:putative RecB family exonuclease